MIWIICKGTKIWFNGICFLSFLLLLLHLLLFEILHQSMLQFCQSLGFYQFLRQSSLSLLCLLPLRPKSCESYSRQMSVPVTPLFFAIENLTLVAFVSFLDASSHLFKRVSPSVGWSVRRSVRPSVTLSQKTKKIHITMPKKNLAHDVMLVLS